MVVCVLGVDPGLGPTTGVCLLTLDHVPDDLRFAGPLTITGRLVYACNAAAAYGLVAYLVEANGEPAPVIAAGEAFVPGSGAGAKGRQAAVTRQVIASLSSLPLDWYWRPAATVKPWATSTRLAKTELLDMTVKMVDARDAAKNALYSACHDAGLPDPLSRRKV